MLESALGLAVFGIPLTLSIIALREARCVQSGPPRTGSRR